MYDEDEDVFPENMRYTSLSDTSEDEEDSGEDSAINKPVRKRVFWPKFFIATVKMIILPNFGQKKPKNHSLAEKISFLRSLKIWGIRVCRIHLKMKRTAGKIVPQINRWENTEFYHKLFSQLVEIHHVLLLDLHITFCSWYKIKQSKFSIAQTYSFVLEWESNVLRSFKPLCHTVGIIVVFCSITNQNFIQYESEFVFLVDGKNVVLENLWNVIVLHCYILRMVPPSQLCWFLWNCFCHNLLIRFGGKNTFWQFLKNTILSQKSDDLNRFLVKFPF